MSLPVMEPPSDFPMDMLVGGALMNLRRWVVEGIAPPRAERLVVLPERSAGPRGCRDEALPLQRDQHGNAVAGVRSPWVDVPLARYYPHSTPRAAEANASGTAGDSKPSRPGSSRPRLSPVDLADLMGCMTRLPPETLRALYGSAAIYRDRFGARLEQLVDERWIAPADGERARAMAAQVDF